MSDRLPGFERHLPKIRHAVSGVRYPTGTNRADENLRRPCLAAPASRRFRYGATARVLLTAILATVLPAVLAQDPRAALNRHLQQAQVYLDGQQYDLVVRELEQAISIHPNIPGAYYQLGLAHWHLQNMNRAKDAFLKELEFEPPDAFSLYYLGRISLTDGNTSEAVRVFRTRCGDRNGPRRPQSAGKWVPEGLDGLRKRSICWKRP